MQEMRGNEDWLKHRGISPGDARSIARKRGPTDGSVNAFVHWLQKINHTGEFYKSELFELYGMGCELAGEKPETCEKWFKRDMRLAGCTTGKDDKRVKGSGPRRVTVRVPPMPTKNTSAITAAIATKTTAKPLPSLKSKPIAKHIEYLSEGMSAAA
jgi:hypothetical protein